MVGTERYVRNSTADFLVFTKDSETDGIEVRVQDHEVWLTQKGIGQLFDVDRSVVAKHLRNIFAENELSESTTCAKFAQVADNGKTYHYKFYSLPAIIAVGYRTNSTRATQFRQWATKVLDTFTRQGYVLDKDRLINGQIFDEDYFDHLVSEIQEIRASERRFYQKITDIYATAVDYSVDSKTTKDFFATVQNKMHYAVHGSTAAEVIVQRADHTKDHMGLTSWKNAPNGKISKHKEESRHMDTLMSLQMSDPIAQHLGSWSQEINVLSICLRIALAVFLTSVIGCERSSKRHSAGLRTFVLISFSSTICMILDIYLMQTQAIDIPILSAATMISAASISGKSILFSSRGQIKGLTTSAALWSCAALGFTIGAGLYTVTLIVFAFLLCILSAFPTIEVYLKNRSNHFEIHLELKNIEYLRDFVTVSRRLGLRIDDIESNPAYVGSGLSVYTITVTICSSELKKYKTHHEIIEALKSLDYIYHLEELR